MYRSRAPYRLLVRALCGAVWLVLASAASVVPVAAHGEVTGIQDVIQDYGVLLFLVATVLIGAGVLAWVTFSPQAGDDEDEDEEGEAEDGAQALADEGAAEGEREVSTPAGSRANR